MTPKFDNVPTYSSTLTPEEIASWGFMPAQWLEAGPQEECSICGCAFSAIEFEGIICPDCIEKQEKGANND